MQLFEASKSLSLALRVVKKLQAEGYQAVFAGGCVRDALLNLPASDIDVATSATPDQVEGLFTKTLPLGKAFGVVVVVEGGQSVEVATFRGESDYQDGRRPSRVEFASAERDARRRDFTVNGMFFDPVRGLLLDFVGGERDLRSRVLRTIGSATERFSEDHLRILRAARFAAQLDFSIDVVAAAAMKDLRSRLKLLSAERVNTELEKLLRSGSAVVGLQILETLKLAEVLFEPIRLPEGLARAIQLRKALASKLAPSEIYWASLLLGFHKSNEGHNKDISDWMKKQKFSHHIMSQVELFLRLADQVSAPAAIPWPHFWIQLDSVSSLVGFDLLEAFGNLQGISPSVFADWIGEYSQRLDPKTGRLIEPLLKGGDLIQAGIPQGPTLGESLRRAYEHQLLYLEKDKAALLKTLLG